jgi:ring-1,2-phenylacetyl-CoA epoxidase subunit PaaD
MKLSQAQVIDWLDAVKDPEIPVISIVDLGVISDVAIEGDHVNVELTPTFTGCPALEMMKNEIVEVLTKRGVSDPSVSVSYREPWSSDKISAKGRAALLKFGLAPPSPSKLFTDLQIIERAECPRCGGMDTELRNAFGPTLCRSIHYCNTCREAFEQFKAI